MSSTDSTVALSFYIYTGLWLLRVSTLSTQVPTLPTGLRLPQGTEPPMGTGDGDDPRSPANRGWWPGGWTPDPRQIGDGGGDGPPIVGVCRAAALNG